MDCRKLYGENVNEQAVSDRYRAIAEEYRRLWGSSPDAFFSSPGRAEIIGNHTDHNGGKVIVAAITCDIVAAVGRRRDGIAEIRSKGFRPVRFRLADTSPHRSEFGRSPALARGVAEGLRRKGIPVAEFGGFSAYTESTVSGAPACLPRRRLRFLSRKFSIGCSWTADFLRAKKRRSDSLRKINISENLADCSISRGWRTED